MLILLEIGIEQGVVDSMVIQLTPEVFEEEAILDEKMKQAMTRQIFILPVEVYIWTTKNS